MDVVSIGRRGGVGPSLALADAFVSAHPTTSVRLIPCARGATKISEWLKTQTGDPRSTLYNTDGQIFSDAGVPCVLFMENYDIHRTGYHDRRDTMENIDLDYGAALVAIAIETVARIGVRPDP